VFKKLCVTAAVVTGIIFLLTPGAPEALFALLFVGIIPGVNIKLSPSFMLVIYIAIFIIGLIVSANFIQDNLHPATAEDSRRERARKRVYAKTNTKSHTQTHASRPHKRYLPVAEP
jgi:hypothetical protein